MDKTTSLCSSIINQEETSTQSRAQVENHRLCMKIVTDLLLIWLDEQINDSDTDYNDVISHLSGVAKMLRIFTDRDQCFDYLTDIKNEYICLIISEDISQQLVPIIHDFDRLQYIFIYCKNRGVCKQWTKNWTKIKGISPEISTICHLIRQTPKKCEQNAVTFSLLGIEKNRSKKKLDQLDPMNMYLQMMVQIILKIPFDKRHLTALIDHCRDISSNNKATLEDIDKFERNYYNKSAVYWYTSKLFLYTTLNQGLRDVDANAIIKMSYFIADLYREIEKLHIEQFVNGNARNSFIVYRGQVVPKVELEKIRRNKGGLIAFNSFLSTSTSSSVAAMFAGDDQIDPDSVSILFTISGNPSKSSTPFASIKNTHYKDEEEIIFGISATFRIIDIRPKRNSPRQFKVTLALTHKTDEDLKILRKHILRNILFSFPPWIRLTTLLLEMGLTNIAKQILENRFDETKDESERVTIYNQLGSVHSMQGNSKVALSYYQKILALPQSSRSNHLDLASIYDNIGIVYFDMGNYPMSLSFFNDSLAIKKRRLPPNPLDIVTSYVNTSGVHFMMGNNPKAYKLCKKALSVKKQYLPRNHPDLASAYTNMSGVCLYMGDKSRALRYCKMALAILRRSLPPNHSDLAACFGNIGKVYFNVGNSSKGLVFLKKALALEKRSLPSNHYHFAKFYDSIALVYITIGNYSKALRSCKKLLAIQERSLPPNHYYLAVSYDHIALVYFTLGDYSKALQSSEKSLSIKEKSLPPNHLGLLNSYDQIGLVYSTIGDYYKALEFLKRSFAIKRQSLPSNHPELEFRSAHITKLYSDMYKSTNALIRRGLSFVFFSIVCIAFFVFGRLYLKWY